MATPTSDKLRVYFPSKYLGADGATLTEQTADAGGTVSTIVDSALTQADDYWNGALDFFEGDTTTSALRGIFFHVMDFTASSDTLTLARELPAAPAAGDTYRLVLGGNYRSSFECFGLEAGGVFPEQQSVTGSNITGLTIKKLSPLLGAGTLTAFYDYSLDELFIKMGSNPYGTGLDVSGDVSDGIVYGSDGEEWVQVDVTAASLPGGDQTDTFTLTVPEGTFTPDFEGSETDDAGGKIRYRLEVVKNTDSTDTMVGLAVYTLEPSGTNTTIDTGESLGTGEGNVAGVDCSDWPAASFWVKNTTQNDCRYVFYRSGHRLYCAAAGGGLRGYTATSWAATDAIQIMADVDIGIDAPSSDQFENPTNETTAPSGITFQDTGSAGAAVSIGDLTAGSIYGVWRRETIIENHRARDDIDADTHYTWT